MNNLDEVDPKSQGEIIEEWLDWPGKPFDWQDCDSPIEDSVFHELHQFAGDQVEFEAQHNVRTAVRTFRLDFLLKHRTTGRPIGIECDGREFHIMERDRMRDEAIIKAGAVARIYRIRGKDCNYCSRDVLQLLAQLEPWIVTERFHQQATFYPHPTTYRDDEAEFSDGYKGIRRTYLDRVGEEYDEQECYCEGECECVPIPVMVKSADRTPTIVRFMSGKGFASAFESPAQLKPLPMPAWKLELRASWKAEKKSSADR